MIILNRIDGLPLPDRSALLWVQKRGADHVRLRAVGRSRIGDRWEEFQCDPDLSGPQTWVEELSSNPEEFLLVDWEGRATPGTEIRIVANAETQAVYIRCIDPAEVRSLVRYLWWKQCRPKLVAALAVSITGVALAAGVIACIRWIMFLVAR